MLIKKFNFADLSGGNKKPANETVKTKDDKVVFEYFGAEVKVEEPKYTESDLKKAKDEAFNKGFQDASKQSQNQLATSQTNQESQIAALCNNIIQKIESVSITLVEKNKQFQQECIELASKIAKRIAGEALKNDPHENIAKLFETSIKEFYSEPEVNVKINPKHLESLNSRFSKVAIQKNFAGKINFIPDSKINEIDCILEWANSGASIKNDEVIEKIDAIISEYCKSIYNKHE
jgi:flagellar biosynthesis/type III secretory pathway protein FliH